MSDSSIEIRGNCPCGERVTWEDTITDETMLICKKCGRELGTYGDFKVGPSKRRRTGLGTS